ncbi:MAG: hypothetical protein ACI9QD_000033 [Thermoproteota archaeon]|jgi:uncharacterized protein
MKSTTLEKIKKYYDNGDPSHDWLHIERVTALCESMAANLGADLRILLPAAYLHDVINIPKDSKLRSQASSLAATKAGEILVTEDFSKSEIERITQVILEHSFSANIKASSLESQILQDADKLDGMGAIGVMRWVTCGTKMKSSYYHAGDPWGSDRELDDRAYSLDHFEEKLLRLNERLNTNPGKLEGKKRLDFFNLFLAQLKTEIN